MVNRTRNTALLGTALLIAACTAATPPTPVAPSAPSALESAAVRQARAETVEGNFRLAINAGRATYQAGEPIEMEAALTYGGPEPEVRVWGSGSGVVHFAIEQVNGPLAMGPAATDDCVPHQMLRGQPTAVPFTKSGGFSADDPDADFWRDFFTDPQLRLPAGQWRVIAKASFLGPDCSLPETALDAGVTITVQ